MRRSAVHVMSVNAHHSVREHVRHRQTFVVLSLVQHNGIRVCACIICPIEMCLCTTYVKLCLWFKPYSLLYIKVILCVTWIVGQSPWRHSLPLLHSYCTWTWTSPSFTSSDRLWCPYCVVSVPSRLVRLASSESGLFRLCFVSFVLWEYYGLGCVWAFCRSVTNLSLACASLLWLF